MADDPQQDPGPDAFPPQRDFTVTPLRKGEVPPPLETPTVDSSADLAQMPTPPPHPVSKWAAQAPAVRPPAPVSPVFTPPPVGPVAPIAPETPRAVRAPAADGAPAAGPSIDITRELVAGQQGPLRQALAQAPDVPPAQAAEARTYAVQFAVPVSVVQRNLEYYRQRANAEHPVAAMQAQSPALAQWLTEGNNAQIAHGDLQHLGLLEWLYRFPERAIARDLTEMNLGAVRTKAIFDPQTQADRDYETSLRAQVTDAGDLGVGESWFRGAVSGLTNLATFLGAAHVEAAGGAAVGAGLGLVVGGPPGAAVGAGLGWAGGEALGLARTAFQTSAGPAYDRFRTLHDEHGQLLPDGVARVAAIAVGTLNGMLMGVTLPTLPGGKLLKGGLWSRPLIESAVEQALQSPVVQRGFLGLAGQTVKGLAHAEGMMLGMKAIDLLGAEAAKATANVTGQRDAPPGQVQAATADLTRTPGPDHVVVPLENGMGLVLPTLNADGTVLSPEAALAAYDRTGQHLGLFDSPDAATVYGKSLVEAFGTGQVGAPGQTGFAPITAAAAGHELEQTAVATLRDFSLATLLGVGSEHYADVRRARQAAIAPLFYKAIAEGTQTSETFKRLPTALQDLATRAMAGGRGEHSYVDTDTWEAYWQDHQIDPDAMADRVTGRPGALAQAKAEGGKLQIETARWATSIAAGEPAHAGFFANELRLGDPDAMNGREVEEFRQDLKTQQAAQDAQPAPEPSELRAWVLGKLAGQGMDAREAETVADFLESLTLADREDLGVGTLERLKAMGLDIKLAPKARRARATSTIDSAAGRAQTDVGGLDGTNDSARRAVEGGPAGRPGLRDDAAQRGATPPEGRPLAAGSDADGDPHGGVSPAGRGPDGAPEAAGLQAHDHAPGSAGEAGFADADTARATRDAAWAAFAPEPVEERFTRRAATDVAHRLTPDVLAHLRHIGDELETFAAVGHTYTEVEGKLTGNFAGGHLEKVSGHGNAKVYKDIQTWAPSNVVTSGKRKGELGLTTGSTNAAMLEAIRHTLDTGEIKTNLAEGAVRVAERRAAAFYKGISRPELPPPQPLPGTPAAAARFLDHFRTDLAEAVTAATTPHADFLDGRTVMGDELGLEEPDDTSFNTDEFRQGLFDALTPPADGDVLDTGEVQPRLPEAGAVRDQEVKTPELEAPFSLTSEVARANKPDQGELFQSGQKLPPGFTRSIAPHLTDDERAHLQRGTAETLADVFRKLPSDAAYMAAAERGEVKRGWYRETYFALRDIFGEQDAWRMAAVLAALSPRVLVPANVLHAVRFFTNWRAAGRPTAEGAVKRLIKRSVAGGGVLDSWVPNLIRAVQAEDPTQIVLSGAKVDSFFGNMVGRWHEVTNDALMAAFAHVEQKLISGTINAAETRAIKRPAYLALSAKIRRVAGKLTEKTGVEWTPEEVQETVWSWFRTLRQLAQSTGESAEALVKRGALTDEALTATPDIATLLTKEDTPIRAILEAAGYGPELTAFDADADTRRARRAGRIGGAADPSDAAVDRPGEAARRQDRRPTLGELRAARHIDEHLAERRAAGADDEDLYQGPVGLTPATVQAWVDDVRTRAGDDLAFFDVHLHANGDLQLSLLAVTRAAAQQGLGSRVMRAVTRFADVHGRRIVLDLAHKGFQPASDVPKTTSPSRLEDFYSRFGFVSNRGRGTDYSIRASMYRDPTVPTPGGIDTFFQSPPEAPMQPAWFSRLTRAVEASTLGKANGAQWKATIRNSKGGIDQGEYALAHVEDLQDGTSYTRQDVLDYLALNQVRVETVTLSDHLPEDTRRLETLRDRYHEEAIHHRLDELDARGTGFEFEGGTPSARFDDENQAWEALVSGEDVGAWYDTEEEAQAYAEAELERRETAAQADYRTDVANNLPRHYTDRANALARDDYERERATQATEFSSYVVEGGDPGSYREVFLTAPARTPEFNPDLVSVTVTGGQAIVYYDGQRLSTFQQPHHLTRPLEVWLPVARSLWAGSPEAQEGTKTWRDGHSDYDHVVSPIVRLRLNTRTASDGARVLFLEEVQPPQPSEFARMPALYQKHWRALAFKWALRQAGEMGLDAVAWTSGKQQADRYSLEKQVSAIYYFPATQQLVANDMRGDEVLRRYDIGPQGIADYVGKELADKLLASPAAREVVEDPTPSVDGRFWVRDPLHTPGPGTPPPIRYQTRAEAQDAVSYHPRYALVGDNLRVGGLGLKQLYDVDFKRVVESLPAVKRLGGKVDTVAFGPEDAGRTLTEIDADLDRAWKAVADVLPTLRSAAEVDEDIAGRIAAIVDMHHITHDEEFAIETLRQERRQLLARGRPVAEIEADLQAARVAATVGGNQHQAFIAIDWLQEELRRAIFNTFNIAPRPRQEIVDDINNAILAIAVPAHPTPAEIHTIERFQAELDARDVAAEARPTRQQARHIEVLNLERRTAVNYAAQHFDAPGVRVTPELRASVGRGQALFQDPPAPQGPPRGVIRFGRGRQISIEVFAHGDRTTLFHEMTGHLFLEMFGDSADRLRARESLTPKQQGLLTDYDAIVATLGGEHRNDITGNHFSREQHEAYAQMWEQYLFNGAAPSLALRSTFARVRAWFTRVYKSVRGLGITLSPEVQGVFDRMLASDEAIAEASAQRAPHELFLTAADAGMSAAEFANYTKTVQEAGQNAREQLDQQLFADVTREQTAEWAREKEQVTAEVTADVDQAPLYRAVAAIRNGTAPDGTPLEEGRPPTPLGLNRELLVERYGADRVARLPQDLIGGADGLDPDHVAAVFGFSSGDALLRAIEQTPTRDVAIVQAVAQRMAAEHGSLLADHPRLIAQAKAALANADRERIIRAELRALQKLRREVKPFVDVGRAEGRAQGRAEGRAAGARATDDAESQLRDERRDRRGGAVTVNRGLPPDAELRAAARVRIAGLTVRDLKPEDFWGNARRSAKIAFDSAARGDYDRAITSKTHELLQLAFYREAVRVKQDLDARVAAMARFTTLASKKRIGLAGLGIQAQIDNTLERFGFVPARPATLERPALGDWLRKMEETGYPVDLPDVLTATENRRPYPGLTVTELVDVTDGVKMIAHVAQLENRLLKGRKAETLSDAAHGLADSIRANFHGTPPAPARDRSDSPVARLFDNFMASHVRLADLAREIDGGKDGGAFVTAFNYRLNDAGAAQASMTADATRQLATLIETAFPRSKKRELYVKREVPGVEGSLSRVERLLIALNWGNEGNRDRQRRYEGWSDEQVGAILNTLDARDLTFVQGVLDLINSYKQQIVDKQERVYGVAPTMVDPVPILTAHGEIPGGYFPLKYDARLSPRAGNFVDLETGLLAKQAAYANATTARGHTKERLSNVDLPIRRDFGVIFEHLGQVIHDLSHHEALIDLQRLLTHPLVSSAIYETHGPDAYNAVKSTIRDVAFGPARAQEGFEQALSYFRSGAATAGLGWSLTVPLLHLSGALPKAVSRIGARWFGAGLVRMMRGVVSTEGSAQWIVDHSPTMATRFLTFNRDLNDIRNQVGAQTGVFSGWVGEAVHALSLGTLEKRDLVDSYFYLVGQSQKFADVPTYLGAFEKARAGGEGEARAHQMATQAVLDAFGGGQLKDLPPVMRKTGMWKLWSTFYGPFNSNFNLLRSSVRGARLDDPKSIGRLGVDFLLLVSVSALAGDAIRAGIKPASAKDDPDEAWDATSIGEYLVEAHLGFLADLMLGTRELAGIIHGYRGWEGPAGASIIAKLGHLYQAGGAVGRAHQAGQTWPQAVASQGRPLLKTVNDVGGIMFHYPAGQLERTISGITAIAEGRTRNPMVLVGGARKKAAGE